MTAEDTIFQEALLSIEQGDRTRARDLLTRLLKIDQNNIQYWLWMSTVVENAKERIYCLKEVWRRDPHNEAARRGLILAGAAPADLIAPPAPIFRRNWQNEHQDRNREIFASRPAWKYVLYAGGLVALAALFVVGVFGGSLFRPQAEPAQAYRMPTVAGTTVATITATQRIFTSTPVSNGPPPLWTLLEATYTPTPLYVNTPHPRAEAYRTALRAYERGDWPSAVNYFQQVATTEPNSADVFYYLGEAHRFQEKCDPAVDAYHKALEFNPLFGPAHLGLARCLLAEQPEILPKSLQEGETHLRDALHVDPNLGEAYLELARLFLLQDNFQAAISSLDEGAALLQNSALYYLYRAEAELGGENIQAALADARKANELDLTLLESYRVLGEALQRSGDLTGSQKPLQTYLDYAPEDGQVLVWLGNAWVAGGKNDAALEVYNRALLANKNQPEVMIARGFIYLDGLIGKDSVQTALDDFNQALRLKPTSFDANLGKGRALLGMGYNGDAYIQFNRSEGYAKSDAEKAQLYYWRAQSLEALKVKDPNSAIAAIHDWQALLELPGGSYPTQWATMAPSRIQALYTSTPTLKPTFTPSPTPTRTTPTPTPSKTSLTRTLSPLTATP